MQGGRVVVPAEKRLFWIGLAVGPVCWTLLGLYSTITLSWAYVILPIIGVLFSCTNAWGYFKCSKDAKAQLQNFSNTIVQGALQHSINSAISQHTGGAPQQAGRV